MFETIKDPQTFVVAFFRYWFRVVDIAADPLSHPLVRLFKRYAGVAGARAEESTTVDAETGKVTRVVRVGGRPLFRRAVRAMDKTAALMLPEFLRKGAAVDELAGVRAAIDIERARLTDAPATSRIFAFAIRLAEMSVVERVTRVNTIVLSASAANPTEDLRDPGCLAHLEVVSAGLIFDRMIENGPGPVKPETASGIADHVGYVWLATSMKVFRLTCNSFSLPVSPNAAKTGANAAQIASPALSASALPRLAAPCEPGTDTAELPAWVAPKMSLEERKGLTQVVVAACAWYARMKSLSLLSLSKAVPPRSLHDVIFVIREALVCSPGDAANVQFRAVINASGLASQDLVVVRDGVALAVGSEFIRQRSAVRNLRFAWQSFVEFLRGWNVDAMTPDIPVTVRPSGVAAPIPPLPAAPAIHPLRISDLKRGRGEQHGREEPAKRVCV